MDAGLSLGTCVCVCVCLCVCVLLSVFVLNMLSYRNSYQLLHDLEIEDPAHGFLPLDFQWTFIR